MEVVHTYSGVSGQKFYAVPSHPTSDLEIKVTDLEKNYVKFLEAKHDSKFMLKFLVKVVRGKVLFRQAMLSCISSYYFIFFSIIQLLKALLILIKSLIQQFLFIGDRGFNPRQGRQHSFMEIDHEIFSMVILSLPLIQEGQLSVSGERMCTILVNRLED